ncbi:MAG: proline--tRNA ligase, partial [Defluviitaleaceae bacterium]|nr:proline--tRNA ligase [Defluviitaleaceae bacterium]
GGLIRTREFTMKDAYSYHTSQEDLEEYYAKAHRAYERIFARAGVPEVVSVASDSGMMGGKISHEFMMLTPIGEDSLVICRDCDYRANMEAAACIIKNESAPAEALQKVHTPNAKTIEDVCKFLNLPIEQSCKAVIYQKAEVSKAKVGEYVIAFIRGDLEVNEAKLTATVQEELIPAIITEESGLVAGYLGPIPMTCGEGRESVSKPGASFGPNISVYFDNSLKGAANLVCGANETDYHYTGFQAERDCGAIKFHDFAKAVENGICPDCGKTALSLSRGIEVGNIFQLGDKYTKSMGMTYTNDSGQLNYPVMGCYGIGVGRLAAAVCEAHHDDYGPIWPMSIAPWQVQLCCVRANDPEAKALADKLYADLQATGMEVIYDDRPVSAGVMFSDADLLGVPIRIIVSPRNIKENCCEVVTRDKSLSKKVETGQVATFVHKLKNEMKATL